MSATRMDTMLSVIPKDMHFVPANEVATKALECFSKLFPYADDYKVETFPEPRFICPELFAGSVTCPVCHTDSSRKGPIGNPGRKWFAQIDEEMSDQPIEGITTVLPNCGHTIPFVQLSFDYPAGFARFVLRASHSIWNDYYISPDEPLSEQEAAMEAILGVPVTVVRTLYPLLRSDRKVIERLVASADDIRLEAAYQLEAYPRGHFEDHFIAPSYVEDMSERLLTAFQTTKHIQVREWILHLISWARFDNDEVLAIAAAVLKRRSETTLLVPILYLIYVHPKPFQHLKAEIKALADYPDQDIRWRCAMAMKGLVLDDSDFEAIRPLLLDPHYATRMEAVFALNKMIGSRALSDEECFILGRVIEMDINSVAATYAKKLLQEHGGIRNT